MPSKKQLKETIKRIVENVFLNEFEMYVKPDVKNALAKAKKRKEESDKDKEDVKRKRAGMKASARGMELECSNNKVIDEDAPEGWEGSVRAMKKHENEIDNPYALAWYLSNKGDEPHYKDKKSGKLEKKKKYKE